MVKRRQLMTLTICLFNLTISRSPLSPICALMLELDSIEFATTRNTPVRVCSFVRKSSAICTRRQKNNENNVYTGQPELTTIYTLRTPPTMFTVAQATKGAVRQLPSPYLHQDET